MDPKNLVAPLRQLFADNFITYWKAHAFHLNTEGPTFTQDHALFQEVYEFLWEWHDTFGEQIRQMGKLTMPRLKDILEVTDITETGTGAKTSKAMFEELTKDINNLLESAQLLFDASPCCGGLNTLVGDYMKALSKIQWKIKATLGRSIS